MFFSNILRKNQQLAVKHSLNNDFSSGVHFHATGTGKSWIALELLLQFNKKYKNQHILWLCEKKSILIDQFNKSIIKEKGYETIFKQFLVLNYSEIKSNTWYSELNSASIWNKPILLIINRAFLVSGKKYTKIKLDFNLIIHDECHSITNSTTRDFYNFILNKNPFTKCIGFSATPVFDFKPFNNCLTSYTIYNAFCDKVILPPKIVWIKSKSRLEDIDYFNICQKNIDNLPYKKIVVWCGTIDYCSKMALLWKQNSQYSIYLDTSENDNTDYLKFQKEESNSILFCACKHREGSDIKNLDGCIFLDRVSNRNSGTFIQCIGRVLRKDKFNKKTYGLIIDFKITSCIKICDRVNSYLNCENKFPWKYETSIMDKTITQYTLFLSNNPVKQNNEMNFNICNLVTKFVKKCPDSDEYSSRLQKELHLIQQKQLVNYLIRAVEILEITNYIPHVTRGSCGSSLVCYLLGISNVDPVKYNISFARFLNDYRESLPDIDFDFPHILRDDVFLKIELQWPNQVARISNHVHWHEKSALRESLRRAGIKKRIPKDNLHQFIRTLSKEKYNEVKIYKKKLENTFRHYSLHCGGIVFYHNGIPDDLVINKHTISQIKYDKRDISKSKHFKIDILSSRGISQLLNIYKYRKQNNCIDFNNCPFDEKTYRMLSNGENIGVTLAESPLMRKALMKIKPKSLEDIAICLAIIRPAAKDARLELVNKNYKDKFIFDDDAIKIISKELNISEGLADKYRRCVSKNKWEKEDKRNYYNLLNKLKPGKRKLVQQKLKNLRKYSFCKSHSYSYAQLVYHLAYHKAHYPLEFWRSTLKNSKSSYKKWVHLYEAFRNGVNLTQFFEKKDQSIYAQARQKMITCKTSKEELYKYGYWNMKHGRFFPNCYLLNRNNIYHFRGLIASSRCIKKGNSRIKVMLICVNVGKFIEIISENTNGAKKMIVKGKATLDKKEFDIYKAIEISYE